ncbi:MAG TPA: hypothetical protein PLP14_06560, partial [Chitinophagaceae bacterium]|nr:hypothetical protein [Chitinophagaceae bacterium]
PSENLLVARRKREVYYKNDTHWNTYGGFIAYQDLMKRIAQDFHQIKPFAESDFTILPAQNHEGDLAAMMGLNRVNPRDEFVMQFKDHKYQLNFDIPTQMILKYHNTLPDTTSLKLIMFRDSFGSYLIPFLNNHFKETVFVWNYIFMNRLIDVEKPDIVVFESLQRFLIYSFLIANPHAIQS